MPLLQRRWYALIWALWALLAAEVSVSGSTRRLLSTLPQPVESQQTAKELSSEPTPCKRPLVFVKTVELDMQIEWLSSVFAAEEWTTIPKFGELPWERQVQLAANSTVVLVSHWGAELRANFSSVADGLGTLGCHIFVHVTDETRRQHAVFGKEYKKWGVVFRNFWSDDPAHTYQRLQANGKLHWLPLGYERQWKEQLLPGHAYQHLLSFVGNNVNNRLRGKLVAEVDRASGIRLTAAIGQDGFKRAVYKNHTLYPDTMRTSAFVLNIPGNSAECYRFYDAMQFGAIPVIVDNFTSVDYTGFNWQQLQHLVKYTRDKGWSDPTWAQLPVKFKVPFVWVSRPQDLHFLSALSHDQIFQLRLATHNWWLALKADTALQCQDVVGSVLKRAQ